MITAGSRVLPCDRGRKLYVKALLSDQLLLFQLLVAYESAVHSRKRPALVTTTFSDSRGGRLRELRL